MGAYKYILERVANDVAEVIDKNIKGSYVPSAAKPKLQTPPSTPELAPKPPSAARIERYTSAVAEFHCPTAGTLIRTSTHSSYEFTNAAGITCGYLDQDGAARERYAIFADGYGRLARHELDALWPLRVGNRVEFLNVDATGNILDKRDYEESFTVVRQELVTVPAGSFDAFVIEWHEKCLTPAHKSDAVVTLWYAPPIGFIVKSAVKIGDLDAKNPVVQSQYSGMDYEAIEIMTPG